MSSVTPTPEFTYLGLLRSPLALGFVIVGCVWLGVGYYLLATPTPLLADVGAVLLVVLSLGWLRLGQDALTRGDSR